MDLLGPKKSQAETRGKSILSWSLQFTAIQERRNMSYNELGKDFFECVKGKKIIVHAYFMLSNLPVWERNSHTDFCILEKRETGAVGKPVTDCCWRNSSSGLLGQWSFSDMEFLGKV